MSAPNIVTLTDTNFPQEVLKSSLPVLVDFWAEWCSPCRAVSPILDELASEYDGRVKIGKVNIEDYQGLAAEYGVRAIPTLLLFKDGQVTDQIVGMKSCTSPAFRSCIRRVHLIFRLPFRCGIHATRCWELTEIDLRQFQL